MPFFSNNTSATTTTTNSSSADLAATRTKAKRTTTNTVTDKGRKNASTPTTTLDTTASGEVMKSVREFEHGRQHAKKQARTEQWRSTKAAKKEWKQGLRTQLADRIPSVGLVDKSFPRRSNGGLGRYSGMRVIKVEDVSTTGAVRDLDVSTETDWECEEAEVFSTTWNVKEDRKKEVDIISFARPGKPRKSKAGDFEVIPKVRSVVVLDDRMNADLEIDDPWEHIDADDSDSGSSQKTSYAEVVTHLR